MKNDAKALTAAWSEAVYNARENWTVSPHEHIERLITAGDALIAALAAPQPSGEAPRPIRVDVSREWCVTAAQAEAEAGYPDITAGVAPRPSGEPTPGSPLPLEHWRTCSAGWDDADCTCGLSWRIRLATEQELHDAWRKRAEEAEAREMARPSGEREATADLATLVEEWQAAHHANEIARHPWPYDDGEAHRLGTAEDALLAWRPSPPGVRPTIEVGDWVLLATRYETDSVYILSGMNTVSSEVEADNFNQRGHWYRALSNQAEPDILEIRKANGVVWRRL